MTSKRKCKKNALVKPPFFERANRFVAAADCFGLYPIRTLLDGLRGRIPQFLGESPNLFQRLCIFAAMIPYRRFFGESPEAFYEDFNGYECMFLRVTRQVLVDVFSGGVCGNGAGSEF